MQQVLALDEEEPKFKDGSNSFMDHFVTGSCSGLAERTSKVELCLERQWGYQHC